MSDKTWGQTKTGQTFHSFYGDGTAICRKGIKAWAGGYRVTETQLDRFGHRKCGSCTRKEAAFRDRLEASLARSNGEGDHLPPAADAEPDQNAPKVAVLRKHPSAYGFMKVSTGRGEVVGYTFLVELISSVRFGWVAMDCQISGILYVYRSQAERSCFKYTDGLEP